MTPSGTASGAAAGVRYAWYRELTGYQWFVLSVASMGWMFCCTVQQLFSLARKPAMRELLGAGASGGAVDQQAANATAIFMIGWAVGGVLFGVLGDRIGRTRTIMLTILSFTLFTAASAFARTVWEFNLCRFLCALGTGGQLGVAVALVAEVVPSRARPYALGLVQASAAIGNMLAAAAGIVLGQLEAAGSITGAWRWEFLAGLIPAPLALVAFIKLKEPEQWLKARSQKQKLGSYNELFSDARWRHGAIVGVLMGFAGVVGLWGIAYFSYDLFRPVLESTFRAQGLSGAALAGKTTTWIGVTSLLQNVGFFFGVYAFTYLTHYTGRVKAFAISFLAAMGATAFTFWNLREISQIFWMIPLMGFTQGSMFGGFTIYFAELFPTRLRSTGVSFCYNVGRFAAAAGPFTLGYLTSAVFSDRPEPMRYAGVAMCLVFLVGLAALPFAPETKGQPLPE